MTYHDELIHSERLEKMLEKKARVFSFTSSNGGVGKTSLSVSVAVLLAKAGYRTLLLHADLIFPEIIYSSTGKRTEENFGLFMERSHYGFDVLSNCSISELMRENAKWSEVFLRKNETEYDYILIDLPTTLTNYEPFVEMSEKVVSIVHPSSFSFWAKTWPMSFPIEKTILAIRVPSAEVSMGEHDNILGIPEAQKSISRYNNDFYQVLNHDKAYLKAITDVVKKMITQ